MLPILGLMLAGSLLTEATASASTMAPGRPQEDEIYAVRSPDVLRYGTASEARVNATNVLEVAISHAGAPHGVAGGFCHITGRVDRAVRGAGLTPRGRIELTVPCVARPEPGTPRRIQEGAFAAGSSSLFYFSADQELLDIERIGD